MSKVLKKLEQEDQLSQLDQTSSSNMAHSTYSKVLLDFIIAHAKNDARPYLEVEIYGLKFLGLLDSGSSRTILGKPGWRRLNSLKVSQTSPSAQFCTVANGQKCEVEGSLLVPFRLYDRVKILEVLIIPSLPHELILGMDFWVRMAIVPDLFSDVWTFRDSEQIEPSVDAIQSIDHLTIEQQRKLESLLQEQFSRMGTNLGCTNMVEHRITTDSAPIKQRHYPISPALQRQVNEELDQMLKDGIVEPSDSPWASPIILVKKPDGKYRFCVDFRQLNRVTKRDAYPLPFVMATLDKLREAHFLTTLDIKSAYWQIPLSADSKSLTAFVVPNRGLYQFTRMPFGLHNAPATWQRFIDRVIGFDLENYVSVYLDDIIVSTPNFDKHLEVLGMVFDRIQKAGLTLNREKCKFCVPELKYLGYVVNASGLMVDPEKVSAILQIPTPKNVRDVRRIVGLASWYRRFIPSFSTMIAPMTALLQKNARFVWCGKCEEALDAVKNHLTSAPILACPNFNLPFIVQTDASDYGLGAVLTQVQDGEERVICYLSRSLTKLERRYSVIEKECLAILVALEKLRPYLQGVKFTVITDHYALKWLYNIKDPIGRIARWSVRLQQYDFDIIHRKGRDHTVPDALSRAVPVLDCIDPSDPTNSTSQTTDKWYLGQYKKVCEIPAKYPEWRVDSGKLYKRRKLKYPDLSDSQMEWLLVIPKDERKELIRNHHEPPTCGHTGIFKTVGRISERYYWPKMSTDVANYIKRCPTCLATKPEQKLPIGQMLSKTPSVSKPWQLASADIVGPLPRSSGGFSYILSICDCFSKFVLLFPMRKATSLTIAKIIEEQVFLVFGAPFKIITDNGSVFRSKIFQEKMKEYHVRIAYTANYHPQANPVERIHRVVKTMLTSYVGENHKSWDKYLPKIGWAIRSAKHEVTGMTPNFINFGREISISGDLQNPIGESINFDRTMGEQVKNRSLQKIFSDVSEKLKKAYDKHKTGYNLRHRDERFTLGQRVWKRNYTLSDATKNFTSKLAPRFTGPFIITQVVSPWTYRLSDDSGRDLGVWHSKDVKAHPPDQ